MKERLSNLPHQTCQKPRLYNYIDMNIRYRYRWLNKLKLIEILHLSIDFFNTFFESNAFHSIYFISHRTFLYCLPNYLNLSVRWGIRLSVHEEVPNFLYCLSYFVYCLRSLPCILFSVMWSHATLINGCLIHSHFLLVKK